MRNKDYAVSPWRRPGFLALAIAVLAALVLLGGLPSGASATNGAYAEVGDAGDLPSNAQVPTGTGALTAITGALTPTTTTTPADADMYRICLTGGKTFSADTTGSAISDPQLFLFDAGGMGVYANDDSGISFQARLPAGHALTPSAGGTYYLAISGFNRDPVSPGGLIFPSSPFSGVFGPTGPGGGQAISGWSGSSAQNGTYTIALTGAEYCRLPDLTCTKELKPGLPPPQPGGTASYIIKCRNIGSAATPPPPTDVVLRDWPPGPVVFWTANTGTCTWNGVYLECKRGRMAPGELWWVELKIKVPTGATCTLVNRATIDPLKRIAESDETNNSPTLVTPLDLEDNCDGEHR